MFQKNNKLIINIITSYLLCLAFLSFSISVTLLTASAFSFVVLPISINLYFWGIASLMGVALLLPSKIKYLDRKKSEVIVFFNIATLCLLSTILVTSNSNLWLSLLPNFTPLDISIDLFNATSLVFGLLVAVAFAHQKPPNIINLKNAEKNNYLHLVLVTFALSLIFGLRIFYLNYIDGLDNFTALSIKNLYQNGLSYYKDSYLLTFVNLISADIFGLNQASIRIPQIMYSLFSGILIYLLVKKYSKITAFISLMLFAISPWSIVLSKVQRDYSFDFLISCFVLFLSDKIRTSNDSLSIKILKLTSISAIVLIGSMLNNRIQTVISLMIAGATVLYLLLTSKVIDFRSLELNLTKKIKAIFIFIFIAIFYFFSYPPFFSGGISLNTTYFTYLFDGSVKSPWQWFHGTSFHSIVIIALFLIPLYISYTTAFLSNRQAAFIKYLYFTFSLCLLVLSLKFYPHSNDYPSRYIYFIFNVYSIIFAFTIYFLTQLKPKVYSFLFIFFILFFAINPIGIKYAVYPPSSIESESDLMIDSINVGRYSMLPVIEYIKENIPYEQETLVFAGRFAEFINWLNLPLDATRHLQNENCSLCSQKSYYDISQNTYVESFFWNQHELEIAISRNDSGYYITEDYCISDTEMSYVSWETAKCLHILRNEDFFVGDTQVDFLTRINEYRIYKWAK